MASPEIFFRGCFDFWIWDQDMTWDQVPWSKYMRPSTLVQVQVPEIGTEYKYKYQVLHVCWISLLGFYLFRDHLRLVISHFFKFKWTIFHNLSAKQDKLISILFQNYKQFQICQNNTLDQV